VADLKCLKSETWSSYSAIKHWTATALIALVQDTVEEEVPFVNKCRLEDVSDTPAFEIANGPVKMISDQCWPPRKGERVNDGPGALHCSASESKST
jgi:hypothetical protein